MAVTMAELIFYIPDSVTMIFLPRVAGLSKEDADALVGRVSRLTVLLTGLVALALVPAAWVGIHLVLPGLRRLPAGLLRPAAGGHVAEPVQGHDELHRRPRPARAWSRSAPRRRSWSTSSPT